jgi:plastocyanin
VNVGNDFFESERNGSVNPGVDTVAVNGTVTWTWIAEGAHGVQFDDPALPIGPEKTASGSQHMVTFPAAGEFTYDCAIHTFRMTGRIVVR